MMETKKKCFITISFPFDAPDNIFLLRVLVGFKWTAAVSLKCSMTRHDDDSIHSQETYRQFEVQAHDAFISV